MFALVLGVCLMGTFAAAQVTIQPKAELYAGYAWLHPGGHYDLGIPTQDHAEGVDESFVYYLPAAHNLGVMFDSSQHFGKTDQNIYYMLGGLQYKYHTDSFSPFFRVFVGAVRQDAPTYIDQWNAALGAGGGIDYHLGHHIGIRVAQADYIYSNYSQAAQFGGGSKQWNSVRLSAGLLYEIGNYYTPTPTAACTAQPTEVTEGEPITVTANGSNFNPKHTVGYAWTTNGGKLDAADTSLRDMRVIVAQIAIAEDLDVAVRARILDVQAKQLEATLLLVRKQNDGALKALEETVRIEDAPGVSWAPPDAGTGLPAHEFFGESLLQLDRRAEAAREFEAALKKTPGRRRSIEGLARAKAEASRSR